MNVLYVLLEGADDQRFFDKILKPELSKKYHKIITYLYASRPKKVTEHYVESLNKNNAEYIVFSDFDVSPCMTSSKNILKEKISVIKSENAAVVQTEIESWYLAGIGYSNSRRLRIPPYPTTDDMSKERFNKIIPSMFKSRIDFMQEILKKFNIRTAKSQNSSFRYVWNKFIFAR